MKQMIIGYQFINYEKDGELKTGYRFHLVSEKYENPKIQGQLVETIYIGTARQELIDEFIKAYKSGKFYRVCYNKYGSPECLIY